MKKFHLFLISILSLFIFSCSWGDDGFYSDIENEVKIANAPVINVYVHYAMTRQGQTSPDGYSQFKVGIPSTISATTEPEYGFVRWAAFSTAYFGVGENLSRNKDIYFIDNEDYETRILPNELSALEVMFENPTLPTTNVTINVQRSDICLVPIIAQRPAVALSIPASGSSKVVRNMAVRISFSKPMDPASFKNADGVFDKITVSQGIQTFTASGDMELNSEDITDHFEFNDEMFSANKKMITLKFTPEALVEGYASQSSVSVTISKDVKDIYGFTMAEDNSISFSVGSNRDTLAPRLSWVSAGVGNQFYAFPGVFKDADTITNVGSRTKLTHEDAVSAPTDDITASYFDTYMTNRIGRDAKINVRVFAEDLAGSGSGQSHDGIEADVTMIAFRAKHLYNADGTPDADLRSKDIEYKPYVPLMNNTGLSGSYRDLVNAANAALPSGTDVYDASNGVLYEYDISDLPDGLIQVDVSAVDVVQNIGFFDGGSCSSEYGNGYVSIFIVKDTTPPDSVANSGHLSVSGTRTVFNAAYYNSLEIQVDQDASNVPLITDPGHARFRTAPSEIKWIVAPDTGSNWAASVSPSDSRWRLITQNYPLSNTTPPSVDGSVAFTYALMDNLGNISPAASFNSVLYDNTAPTVGTLGMTGINGYTSSSITGNVLVNQVLSIPVTDATAGVKKLKVEIACVERNGAPYSGAVYGTPFASSADFEIKVDGAAVAYNTSGTEITFTEPLAASRQQHSGAHTLTIKGLQIADDGQVEDNSIYRITVTAIDDAENVSSSQIRDIGCDSTPPVINRVKVLNINSAVVSGSTEYWSTEPSAVTSLYINLTETNTGARVFNFTNSSISLVNSSTLSWNGTNVPVSIDATGKILTITSEDSVIKTSSTGGEVVISNVVLTDSGNNTVNLTVSDLVTNTSTATQAFTLSDNTTTFSSFKYDSGTPSVSAVALSDQENGPGGAAEAGFTDSEYIEANITTYASDSGISQIIVSGATFDNTTKVNGKLANDASLGFTITNSNTITLKTNNNAANRIYRPWNQSAITITINNVKLPAGDDDKTVSFTVKSLGNKASVSSSSTQATIKLDTTAPAWSGDGIYVATSNSDTSIIYPHSSTATSGNVKISDVVYFYTQSTINIAAAVTESNRKDSNIDLYIDNAGPVSEFENVSSGTHTAYAVDKAGNKSAVKTFYVVEDTSAPAAFEGYVTFTMPSGGSIYRGNPASGSIKNYILKTNSGKYQVHVKLTGVTASDKDVHGSNRTALSGYAELSSRTDKSPIEYYAVSTDSTQNWQSIGTGDFSIDLATSTPYTIYLKDGCGNVTNYQVPVNWIIDGSITSVTNSNLDLSTSIVTNATAGVNYYRGNSGSTPTVTVTGINDTCYFSNNNTSDGKYTLRSRLLVIPSNQSLPSDLSTVPSTQLTDWKLYKSTGASDNFNIEINYPAYDTTSPYKLYILIEDTLGNTSVTQIKNGSNELWLWDNDDPVAVVKSNTIQKVNTIDNKNYYSANSSVKYDVTDPKSGIKNDGSTVYPDSAIPKVLADKDYPLGSSNPDANEQLTINGMQDYAGNTSSATGLVISSGGANVSHWVKQVAPVLTAPTITGKDGTTGTSYSRDIGDHTTGANTFKEETSNTTNGVLHTITASRSVTGVKVLLNVTTNKINSAGAETADDSPLLGWIVRTSPLTSPADFYASGSTEIQTLTNNEVEFTKTDTSVTWNSVYSGTRYYYAVNRAGLVSSTAIMIEFASNTIPAISGDFTYTNVVTYSGINKNFLKSNSKIGFTTNTALTSANNPAELYKGSSTTPVTVTYTASAITATTYSIDSTFLSSVNDQSLKIKLFTDTEVSDLIDIPGTAGANSWIYDANAPVINRVEVEGLTRGTEDGGSTFEYWATGSTNSADVIITLTEERSGVREFNFADSSVSLTSSTALYDVTNGGSGTLVSNYSVNTTNKIITISTFDDAIKGSSKKIKVTNVELLSASATPNENTIKLKLKDVAQNETSQCENIKFDDTVIITSFKYDPNAPTVTSLTLEDRAGSGADAAESGYTNEEQVNATVEITASASGVSKLTVSGATFVSGTTTISVGGSTIAYTTTDNSTVTFNSNKVIKGTFTAQINNLTLQTGDGSKTVSITATSLGNKTSTSAAQASITLDTVAPAWVDDGVYVSTNNTNTSTIYHHSSTASSGNLKRGAGNDIYFFTKNQIKIAASVTETNRKAGNADLYVGTTTTPVAELELSPASSAYSLYCIDKAGNRSAAKTFYVKEDTTAPGDISSNVTFTMPSGGNIFRGNGTSYVIKQLGDASDPYKIIIKLNGAAAGDSRIDGSSYSSASSAYDSYSNATTAGSPVEYYKISGDSETGAGSVNTDWIATSTLSGGLITIGLPKTRNCSALSITLKDGCGNESSAYSLGGVSWVVDGSIGTVTPSYENVVTNNSVNYHKNIASVSLACPNDSCFYDSYGIGNASEFTLRGCLVAIPGTATVSDWNTVDLSNLDSSWSKSNWYNYKATSEITAITMPFSSLPALTSSYKLFYVVEDRVGNRTAGQITSNLWMADNTAPEISNISFTNVRIDGSTYYFSNSSKVTYTVTDAVSGITKSDSSVGDSETRDVLLKDILESNVPTISGVADIVGNSITAIALPQGETGINWIRYTTTPDHTKAGVNVTNGSGTATGIESAATSAAITARRAINSIKVNLTYAETVGSDELFGWVKSSTALTSFNAFYNTVDIAAGGYDTFTKADTTTAWSHDPVYYYAVNKAGIICQTPVTVSFASNPVPAVDGDITWNNITAYGIGTADAVNYTKSTSAIKFATSNSPTQYRIFKTVSGTDTDLVAQTNLPSDFATNGIPLGGLTALTDNVIKLQLYTATEVSDVIELTGPAGANKWTYDATAPEFTMAVSDSVVVSSVKYVTGDAAVLTFTGESSDIMRYEYKASAATEAWSDTPSELTSPYQLAVTEGTSTIYTIRAVDRAGNYSTNAEVTLQKDATAPTGSISYTVSGAAAVTAADSSTGATGDYVATAVTDDTTGITTTTIAFNSTKVNKITFTPDSISDSGVGFVYESSKYKGLYFKIGDDLGNALSVADAIEYTVSGTTNVTVTLIVKDQLGNAKTLGIFVLKGCTSTGPAIASELSGTSSVQYTGLPIVPTYPKVEANPNDSTNSSKWIKGFASDSNYAITTTNTGNSAYEEKDVPNGLKVIQYENTGTPKSPVTYTTTGTGWKGVYIYSDSIEFKLPVKPNSLPSNKLYYKVTYNNSVEPTDGWTLAEVHGEGDSGYISGVAVQKASITCTLTFVFVWYKDEFGNICVHSLTNPTNTGAAWWTTNDATISNDASGNAEIPFTRNATGSGNNFITGITDLFRRFSDNNSAEPLETRSVDLLSPEPVFADKPVSAAKPAKKTVKKAAKKAAVKKSSIIKAPAAEVVEKIEAVETVVTPVITDVVEAAVVTESVTPAEEITAAPVAEVSVLPAAEVTAEPSVVTAAESGVNPKLLCVIFAAGLTAIVIALVAIAKMLRKK